MQSNNNRRLWQTNANKFKKAIRYITKCMQFKMRGSVRWDAERIDFGSVWVNPDTEQWNKGAPARRQEA